MTEVCAEKQVVIELCALCRCLSELMSRILRLALPYICHLIDYSFVFLCKCRIFPLCPTFYLCS